jgi:hypothetical protein
MGMGRGKPEYWGRGNVREEGERGNRSIRAGGMLVEAL